MAHSHHDHGRSHDHDHHDHDHDHGHEHHHHASVTQDSQRRVFWVMLLVGVFMVVEVIGGLLSGSLALLADAGHMLSDTGALALAWFAFMFSARRPDNRRTYGYPRFQILAALINALTLFALAGWIIFEAYGRFVDPVPVMGVPMLVVAFLGLAVNIVAFLILHRGDSHNVNMRGALLHVVGDLLGSVGAIAAALIILATGWMPIDPLLSILVAVLILRSAWFLLRQTLHILMEGAPEGMEPATIRAGIEQDVNGIEDVHHIHVWALTQEQPLATLHVTVKPDVDGQRVLREVKALLESRFGVQHCTVQIEHGHCPEQQGCVLVTGT